jgi:hypothetical protein
VFHDYLRDLMVLNEVEQGFQLWSFAEHARANVSENVGDVVAFFGWILGESGTLPVKIAFFLSVRENLHGCSSLPLLCLVSRLFRDVYLEVSRSLKLGSGDARLRFILLTLNTNYRTTSKSLSLV